MRDHRLGNFLEIVGRQHIVVLPTKVLEEPPSAPRDQAQFFALGGIDAEMGLDVSRVARPARDAGEKAQSARNSVTKGALDFCVTRMSAREIAAKAKLPAICRANPLELVCRP